MDKKGDFFFLTPVFVGFAAGTTDTDLESQGKSGGNDENDLVDKEEWALFSSSRPNG